MKLVVIIAGACIAAAVATPASAGEVFVGLYKHDVETGLTASGNVEKGADVQLGWRGGRVAGTPIQPYVYGSLNTSGGTSFAAAGLSARFGDNVYVRPGLGLAVHTGSDRDFQDPTNDRIEFGSRILFAPELAVGIRVAPRITAEASIVHLSHGQLFGRQNPGMDSVGVRVNFELP